MSLKTERTVISAGFGMKYFWGYSIPNLFPKFSGTYNIREFRDPEFFHSKNFIPDIEFLKPFDFLPENRDFFRSWIFLTGNGDFSDMGIFIPEIRNFFRSENFCPGNHF